MKIDFETLYKNFDGDIQCPPDCNLCGSADIVENIILLFEEKEYLESHNYPCSFERIQGGIWTIPQNCTECKGCHPDYKEEFRPIRSIDCRTFPFVVFSDGNDGTFNLMLSTNCPMSSKLSPQFIKDVKLVWTHLLQFKIVRDDIKTLCSLPNLNTKLHWRYHSTIGYF